MQEINPNAIYTLRDLQALFSDRLIETLRATGLRSPGNGRARRENAQGEALYFGRNILDALASVCEARRCQRGLSGKEVFDEISDTPMETHGDAQWRTETKAKQRRSGTLLGAVAKIERDLRSSTD